MAKIIAGVHRLPHGVREFIPLSNHDVYRPGYWVEGNIHGVAVRNKAEHPAHLSHNPPRAILDISPAGRQTVYSTNLPADEISLDIAEQIVRDGELAEDRKYKSGRPIGY